MNSVVKAAVALVWLLAYNVHAHVEITYPGWRGNNLITNSSFPYGMQRAFPCGGLEVTQNRTAWPISGGAVALQPGWFAGHATALMYMNIWLGEEPDDYTVLRPVFRILGPSDNPYPGTICLPQISLPSGVAPSSGDVATIQVVQTLKSGASLFSCADIVFTDDLSQVPPITDKNCFNSTNIKVEDIEIIAAADVQSCSATPTTTGTSDVWGTASTTNSRANLFTSSTATTTATVVEQNVAARSASRFSGLLSFLLLI